MGRALGHGTGGQRSMRWRSSGSSVLFICVTPLLRCRQTLQGSTSPPVVLTRTSPFLTSPQASAWLPCLAIQVSIAPLLYSWNSILDLYLVSCDPTELSDPSLQPATISTARSDRSVVGNSVWLTDHILCSSQRLSLA